AAGRGRGLPVGRARGEGRRQGVRLPRRRRARGAADDHGEAVRVARRRTGDRRFRPDGLRTGSGGLGERPAPRARRDARPSPRPRRGELPDRGAETARRRARPRRLGFRPCAGSCKTRSVRRAVAAAALVALVLPALAAADEAPTLLPGGTALIKGTHVACRATSVSVTCSKAGALTA